MPTKPRPVKLPPPPPSKTEPHWYRKAFLEIMIIIVGILLSVLITDFFADQKNNKRETLYLKELVQDLEDDLLQLEFDHNIRKGQLEHASELLQVFGTMGLSDAPAPLVAEKLKELSKTVHFNPNMATFRALESTGRVELIKNEKVIRSLITLYTDEYDQLQINNNDLNTYRNNFLLPFAVENLDFSFAIGSGQAVWLTESPDLAVLQNHVIYNQLSLRYTVSAYKRAVFKAQETLKMVTDELE